VVERRKATTSLFGFSRIQYRKRVLVLTLPRRRVEIDVSTEFAEFPTPQQIEDEVRRLVPVRGSGETRSERRHWLYGPVGALPVFLIIGVWYLIQHFA
jgi:hypothetical protein